MKKKNFSLDQLKVKSFITGTTDKVKGGTAQEISKQCEESFYTDCPTHLYCPSLQTNCNECFS
ncbi:hypothetical protein AB9P05_12650 [Roseivirga sp. BDSF3-8]|uniref:hypothetical protein n=1 Tax=Roseivirga sp. BDSF3-8 TaxID=3241598 RepID=UPI0035323B5F